MKLSYNNDLDSFIHPFYKSNQILQDGFYFNNLKNGKYDVVVIREKPKNRSRGDKMRRYLRNNDLTCYLQYFQEDYEIQFPYLQLLIYLDYKLFLVMEIINNDTYSIINYPQEKLSWLKKELTFLFSDMTIINDFILIKM